MVLYVLASVVPYFRGSYRQHAVEGLYVNKGDPSGSSGACRVWQANNARKTRWPFGSQTGW